METALRSTALTVVGIALLSGPALATQPAADPGSGIGFVGTFLVYVVLTLVIGALVLALGPEYTRSIDRRIREEPVESGLYGLATVIGLFVATFVLVITVIGILLWIPLVLAFFVVALVGDTIAAITIGAALHRSVSTSGESTLGIGLLLGAVVVGFLVAIPVVGGLVGFVVSTVGVGAMVRSWWLGRDGKRDPLAAHGTGRASGRDRNYGSGGESRMDRN